MAKVDFGSWSPPRIVRSEIEQQAAMLPGDWTVSVALDADGSRPVNVLVKGGPFHYSAHFHEGRSQQVGSFLAAIALNVGRR